MAENSAITTIDANDNNTGNDTDRDGDVLILVNLTQVASGTIVSGSNCSSLPGTYTFDTGTGVLDWTPNFSAVGDYEMRLVLMKEIFLIQKSLLLEVC